MNEEAGDLPDQRVMDCKAAVVSAESKDDERIPTVWPLLRLEAVHIHSPTSSQEPSSLSAMALCCHRYFDPEQGRPRCQHLLHQSDQTDRSDRSDRSRAQRWSHFLSWMSLLLHFRRLLDRSSLSFLR